MPCSEILNSTISHILCPECVCVFMSVYVCMRGSNQTGDGMAFRREKFEHKAQPFSSSYEAEQKGPRICAVNSALSLAARVCRSAWERAVARRRLTVCRGRRVRRFESLAESSAAGQSSSPALFVQNASLAPSHGLSAGTYTVPPRCPFPV